ncbi:MAG: DUF1186 domain-containing protein [Candidatus Acidiferrales bacterium]
MRIEELLAGLNQPRDAFPNELIAELISRRAEAIPLLLGLLEALDRDPGLWLADGKRMDHIYAFYLLAQFREPRAYPLLVSIFSRPGEFPFDLAGDVVTEDLGPILASVSCGDMSGMTTLVENERANEWVRAAALSGLVLLVDAGERTREEVMEYLLRLFRRLERKPGAQWDSVATACADLWPHEALADLRPAYEEGLVDPMAIAWDDVEYALRLGKEGAMHDGRYGDPLIRDVAWDMRWMSAFRSDEELPRLDDTEVEIETNLPELLEVAEQMIHERAPVHVRRDAPKTGRNEPCPCGSGKKYKKCCAVE